MSAIEAPQDSETSRGEGLSGQVLFDPVRIAQDSRMITRAIKERWPVPEDRKAGLVDRLFGIVAKTSVTVLDKRGEPVELDEKADTNAIAAARVIVQMEGQNQTEQYGAPQTQFNVGLALNNNTGPSAREVAIELLKTSEGRVCLTSLTSDE